MNKLIAGIDEVGTETQKVEGWCYFCISKTEYKNFENEVKTLLATNSKLKSFHGKKFKMGFSNEYEQFLHKKNYRVSERLDHYFVPTIRNNLMSFLSAKVFQYMTRIGKRTLGIDNP